VAVSLSRWIAAGASAVPDMAAKLGCPLPQTPHRRLRKEIAQIEAAP
jgi:hypothetical protein